MVRVRALRGVAYRFGGGHGGLGVSCNGGGVVGLLSRSVGFVLITGERRRPGIFWSHPCVHTIERRVCTLVAVIWD